MVVYKIQPISCCLWEKKKRLESSPANEFREPKNQDLQRPQTNNFFPNVKRGEITKF